MEAKPNVQIIELMSRVMEDVGAVSKGQRNQQQNFNFRGIDAVVNAVSPALRKHGVVVTPEVQSVEYTTVEIGKNHTSMGHCRVTVTYKFYAPDGSFLPTTVSAESMDSGDKATAKAMSVAFRTCLLQTLCLPTDDTDPDAESYERAPAPAPKRAAPVKKAEATDDKDAPLGKQKLLDFAQACAKADLDHEQVADFAGVDLSKATNGDLELLRAAFAGMKKAKENG